MPYRIVLFSVLLCACGSKNGLEVPGYEPALEPDAGAQDAGRDAGRDAGALADAGPEPEPCVEIPFGPTPQVFDLDFEARIVAADIVFLIDNTASMGALIDEVETTLRTRLIPGLLEAVPDLQMAVAVYRDFGFSPYGSTDDIPFEVLQTSTDDEAALQLAVERMYERGGGDEPEAGNEALYQLATGGGLSPYIPVATCPAGGLGAACLRRTAVPIVVVFTDAPFHNGPSLPNSYIGFRPPAHTYEETIDALNAGGFRALGLLVGSGFMFRRTRADLEALARDTGAVTPRGEPIVLDLGGGSRPLTGRVIDAVESLVDETTIDVDAVAEDVPGDAVDASRFVRRVTAFAATPPGGARIEGGRFVDVTPGTRVEYRFEVLNDFVPPGPVTARYPLRLILRDGRGARLRERVVDVVVPSDDGGGCD